MGNVIGAITLDIVAVVCFVFRYLQFNKKPHYKQSGIVFLMIGIIFTINAVDMILKTGWLFYVVIVIAIIAIIYAIASSVIIEKNKK